MSASSLNPEQKKAVEHTTGPMLIVAGAGTGKTHVLVEKITHLIRDHKVRPENILALTFTEKAAYEMEERVDRALPYGYIQTWISTFHSFADQILRDDASHIGINPSYTLLTQAQTILFLRRHLFSFNLRYFRPLSNPNKFISGLLQHFSRLRDENIRPEEYVSWAHNDITKKKSTYSIEEQEKYQELAKAYQTYQDLKVQESVFDFGDLIFSLLRLLEQRPSLLDKYRGQFSHVLVDEFQDTNIAQYELIKLLCPPNTGPNLTVVGDDSQAIYKFRGASLSNILTFMEDYPQAAQVTLQRNYRSYQHILDSSHHLITHNNPYTLEHKLGISKRLQADRKKKKGTVSFTIHEKVESESEHMVDTVLHLREEKGYAFSDMALLVRANNHAEPFLASLRRKGVPYRFLGPGALFKQPEVKDLIAYLSVLYDATDTLAFYRVLSMHLFKLDGMDLNLLLAFARKVALSLFEACDVYCSLVVDEQPREEYEQYRAYLPLITEFSKQTLQTVRDMVKRHLSLVPDHTAGEILYYFLQDTGYLQRLAHVQSEEDKKAAENIGRFFSKLKSFETDSLDASVRAVTEYIDISVEIGESPQAEDIDTSEYDAVNILTIHASKGLEFPIVFLPNLTKGRFPTTEKREQIPLPPELIQEIVPEGNYHLQEERRLFYVGITRACNAVYLSASKFYTGGKRERKLSPFVGETVGEDTVRGTLMIQEEEKTQMSIFDFKPSAPQPVVKKSKVFHTFSYSQLETFLRCPLEYKYRYILKLPSPPAAALSFGQTLHQTLQDFYKEYENSPQVGKTDMLRLYKQNWVPVGYSSQQEIKLKKKAGEDMLLRYLETYHHRDMRVIGIERNFKIKIDEATYLSGKMDRIDAKGGGAIEIIDYKTGSVPSEAALRKNLQLPLYALAAMDPQLFGKKPEEIFLTFYYLQDMQKITKQPSKEKILLVKQKVRDIITQIRVSDFQQACGMAWCSVCGSKVV